MAHIELSTLACESPQSSMDSHYSIDNFQFEGSIAHALRSAASHIDLELRRIFGAHKLTYEQWAILMFLRKKPASTAAEISRNHHHDAGSLSRAIDDLVRRGLIKRELSKQDRRAILLHLASQGSEVLSQLQPQVIKTWKAMLREFDRSELEIFGRLLERFGSAQIPDNETHPKP